MREPLMNRRGKFIVLEGLDGAGTTTQTNILGGALRELGKRVELTREPSSGPIGAVARAAIEGRLELDARVLALAFAADRLDHIHNTVNGINALLEQGVWVVSDRYVLSALAYQHAQGIDLAWLTAINSQAILPDLTIFVDTSTDVCVARIAARSNTTERFHDADELRRVRKSYKQALARTSFIDQLATINGDEAIEVVAKNILTEVENFYLEDLARHHAHPGSLPD